MKENIYKKSRIAIITGAPGTGKTTISRILAEKSTHDKAVHIKIDDFWQYIRKGYIHPWLDDSGEQNETVVESLAASAEKFSENGYEVFVDGAIGSWFLEPWIKIAQNGVDVRYIVLRPDEQTTVSRVINREQNKFFPLSNEIVKKLWRDFAEFGYDSHSIDTTNQTIEESVIVIQKILLSSDFRINP